MSDKSKSAFETYRICEQPVQPQFKTGATLYYSIHGTLTDGYRVSIYDIVKDICIPRHETKIMTHEEVINFLKEANEHLPS